MNPVPPISEKNHPLLQANLLHPITQTGLLLMPLIEKTSPQLFLEKVFGTERKIRSSSNAGFAYVTFKQQDELNAQVYALALKRLIGDEVELKPVKRAKELKVPLAKISQLTQLKILPEVDPFVIEQMKHLSLRNKYLQSPEKVMECLPKILHALGPNPPVIKKTSHLLDETYLSYYQDNLPAVQSSSMEVGDAIKQADEFFSLQGSWNGARVFHLSFDDKTSTLCYPLEDLLEVNWDQLSFHQPSAPLRSPHSWKKVTSLSMAEKCHICAQILMTPPSLEAPNEITNTGLPPFRSPPFPRPPSKNGLKKLQYKLQKISQRIHAPLELTPIELDDNSTPKEYRISIEPKSLLGWTQKHSIKDAFDLSREIWNKKKRDTPSHASVGSTNRSLFP